MIFDNLVESQAEARFSMYTTLFITFLLVVSTSFVLFVDNDLFCSCPSFSRWHSIKSYPINVTFDNPFSISGRNLFLFVRCQSPDYRPNREISRFGEENFGKSFRSRIQDVGRERGFFGGYGDDDSADNYKQNWRSHAGRIWWSRCHCNCEESCGQQRGPTQSHGRRHHDTIHFWVLRCQVSRSDRSDFFFEIGLLVCFA